MKDYRMSQLRKYKAGKISLGALAEALDLSTLETLKLVSAHNAHPKVPKDYLVEAAAMTQDVFKEAHDRVLKKHSKTFKKLAKPS